MHTDKSTALKRSISLPMLIFYGLGTMIGGGIYALVGKVAGAAGMAAPFSFMLSAVLALLTAFSYAELSSRYPVSAGEVKYVNVAFSQRYFSMLVGWLVIFMGISSTAALTNATAGFIQDFVDLPTIPLIILLVATLGGLAAWGISESVTVVMAITLIELAGLLFVVMTGSSELASLTTRWSEIVPPATQFDMIIWGSILSGAFLAFYAFIGFEDMVNVAEEVKDVRRTMPIAIIACICITMLVYMLVITVAVLAVPTDELAASNTPLRLILEHTAPGTSTHAMGFISMLATINGALVQTIMATRVLYGMAGTHKAPVYFRHVSYRTRTPVRATLLIVVGMLVFALWLDLESLARTTSAIILFIFTAVNAALLKLKWTQQLEPYGGMRTPWWACLAAFVTCLAMFIFGIFKLLS